MRKNLGKNNQQPYPATKLSRPSLPSTAAMNACSMYFLANRVTNSTIVQPSQSLAVQLYAPLI